MQRYVGAVDVDNTLPGPQTAEQAPVHATSLWVRILIGRRPRTTFIRLACLVTATLVLFGFVYLPVRITGNSMAPTYRTGRPNLVNRLSYRWHEPQRGDVV